MGRTQAVDRPDPQLEQEFDGVVAGVDEAGRGPLAGPVIAAAVILPCGLAGRLRDEGLDDSKHLSPARRQALSSAIQAAAWYSVAAASVLEIDRDNILQASLRAMQRAVMRLPVAPDYALIDGLHKPVLPCPARAVVNGDRLYPSVAAASIIAKVFRDRLMSRLAGRYPLYHWHRNRGYPTKTHNRSIRNLGITPHHRRSFAPVTVIACATPGVTKKLSGG